MTDGNPRCSECGILLTVHKQMALKLCPWCAVDVLYRAASPSPDSGTP
jgi:predicted RNA-binding Zn-ribbon protein involved in translation (DUF1610 family)